MNCIKQVFTTIVLIPLVLVVCLVVDVVVMTTECVDTLRRKWKGTAHEWQD